MSVAVLARCGRSFRLAGRLLPGDTLQDAAALYAFCRMVDDLADESTDLSAQRGVLSLQRLDVDGHSATRSRVAVLAKRSSA